MSLIRSTNWVLEEHKNISINNRKNRTHMRRDYWVSALDISDPTRVNAIAEDISAYNDNLYPQEFKGSNGIGRYITHLFISRSLSLPKTLSYNPIVINTRHYNNIEDVLQIAYVIGKTTAEIQRQIDRGAK